MQPSVPSAKIEQRVEAGIEARLDHAPNQDVMVAAVINREALALEHPERFLEDRGARFAAGPGSRAEAVLVAGGKADGRGLLPGLQDVDREMRGLCQRGARSAPSFVVRRGALRA